MLTQDAVKMYLLEIEIRRYTPKTIRSYASNLNFFFSWLKKSKKISNIEDMSIIQVKEFVASLLKNDRKATYINNILKTLRSFLVYCNDENYCNVDLSKLKWRKEEKVVIQTFTNKEAKQLIAFYSGNDFNSIRNKTIVMMLFETGIRCYELCCLRVENMKEGFMLIDGKNHKQRAVPLTPLLEQQLLRYRRAKEKYFDNKKYDGEYYFLSRTGRQLTNNAVENFIRQAGTNIADVRVSPHTCRHFFAQAQLKNGMDIYSLSRILGHENIAITQRYLRGLKDKDIMMDARQRSVIRSL